MLELMAQQNEILWQLAQR
jgi:hypothetical protein